MQVFLMEFDYDLETIMNMHHICLIRVIKAEIKPHYTYVVLYSIQYYMVWTLKYYSVAGRNLGVDLR